jgi:serine phosphatase RsbU (regulator of sigma subunit)
MLETKKPASEIVGKVCAELSSFTAGVEPFDDMTVIVLKRTG